MSELVISSTNWLAVSLRNNSGVVFNLNNLQQWQHLKVKQTINKTEENTEDDDEDLNRNLIKFTPDGQRLVLNGQNKQIYIYTISSNVDDGSYWQLQRIVTVKKRASAIDSTNELMFIADKSGDVYRTNLTGDESVTLTFDDCIMGHLSMLLDVAFVSLNNNQQFLLTTDRDEKIRLSHHPNAYNIQGYCLGHTEFVSHVTSIDRNHILSASGDGTIRLWQLPDCVEVQVFETENIVSTFRNIFLNKTSSETNENELSLESSPMDYAIWNIDIASARLLNVETADVFIAFSIYGYRSQSIYLTTLNDLEKLTDRQCKLTFHSNYGAIVDYRFSLNEFTSASKCYLYVLFDSNILLKVDVLSLLSCDEHSIFHNQTTMITQIDTNEFNFSTSITSNEVMFKQLFKMRGQPGDSAYYKRKTERIEQQEEKRRRKQNTDRTPGP